MKSQHTGKLWIKTTALVGKSCAVREGMLKSINEVEEFVKVMFLFD